jgi:hypothetical protein
LNAGSVIGLILFVIGIILLVLWAFDISVRGSFLVPGIICVGGGFVIMWMLGRGGKS